MLERKSTRDCMHAARLSSRYWLFIRNHTRWHRYPYHGVRPIKSLLVISQWSRNYRLTRSNSSFKSPQYFRSALLTTDIIKNCNGARFKSQPGNHTLPSDNSVWVLRQIKKSRKQPPQMGCAYRIRWREHPKRRTRYPDSPFSENS